MNVSAHEIDNKKFHDAWRGYNQNEVDDFLDSVALTVANLQRENEALRERIAELDEKVEASKGAEEVLRQTLAGAQNAAQEAIASAKARAEQIVADAEERAQRAREELRMRVETAEEEVRRRSAEVEREQSARRQQLEASVDELRAHEGELKRKLRAFLDQQSHALEVLQEGPARGGEEPPLEIVTDEPIVDLDGADEVAPVTTIDAPEERDEVEAPEETSDDDRAGEDLIDEPSLESFAPFDDEEEAFGDARRRKRGLFGRRDRDLEVEARSEDA